MPIFQWKARTRQGEPEEGRDGGDERSRRDGAASRADAHCPSRSRRRPRTSANTCRSKQGDQDSELVIFTRQFATMIDAGLPLVQCLDILGTQSTNKTFKEIIRR